MRTCSKCTSEFPDEYFIPRSNHCIECRRAYQRAYMKKRRAEGKDEANRKRSYGKRLAAGYWRERSQKPHDSPEVNCTSCKATKPSKEFRNGHSQCKECERECASEYKKRPEVKVRNREYQKSPARREWMRKYKKRPHVRKKEREYMRKWWHTEAGRRLRFLRRSAKKEGDVISDAEWQELLEEYGNACAYCGREFGDDSFPEVDHVVPIINGGAHTKGNIVPACRNCKAQKSDKLVKHPEPGNPALVFI